MRPTGGSHEALKGYCHLKLVNIIRNGTFNGDWRQKSCMSGRNKVSSLLVTCAFIICNHVNICSFKEELGFITTTKYDYGWLGHSHYLSQTARHFTDTKIPQSFARLGQANP